MKSYSEIRNSYRRAFISKFHVVSVVHKSVDADFLNFSVSLAGGYLQLNLTKKMNAPH